MGIREQTLQFRRGLFDYRVSKSEPSHRLHCSGRRHISCLSLIHGFTGDATLGIFMHKHCFAEAGVRRIFSLSYDFVATALWQRRALRAGWRGQR
ncbi:MAG: hypothetical protein J0H84_17515 [Rhizobiales bacterium]|nr:hypothetical protein [Hyphomicrobiales bacterium]